MHYMKEKTECKTCLDHLALLTLGTFAATGFELIAADPAVVIDVESFETLLHGGLGFSLGNLAVSVGVGAQALFLALFLAFVATFAAGMLLRPFVGGQLTVMIAVGGLKALLSLGLHFLQADLMILIGIEASGPAGLAGEDRGGNQRRGGTDEQQGSLKIFHLGPLPFWLCFDSARGVWKKYPEIVSKV